MTATSPAEQDTARVVADDHAEPVPRARRARLPDEGPGLGLDGDLRAGERNTARWAAARSCESGSLKVDRISNEGIVYTSTTNSSGYELAGAGGGTNPSTIDRRAFIAGVALGLAAAPLGAGAQPRGKTWRVGFLSGGARTPDGAPPLPLRQALKELGYVEPQNVVYLGRWAEARQDRLPQLAAELVELKVDVIVTAGGPASGAAKRATSSIPIVMAIVGDADGIGLIESLARPGGNVTGVTDQSVELSAKRMEFLTEAVPKAARIAVLWNADDRGMTLRYREVEKAAQRLHVAVQPLGVREPDDFDAAFSAMAAHRPDALFLVTDALTLLNRKRVIDFALTHRIPAMYEFSLLVRDGGLMSYGANQDDNYRRAARYVDRIFKGAAPSALPVERPGRYYLTINLSTARALGLIIPQSLLLRADEVIE